MEFSTSQYRGTSSAGAGILMVVRAVIPAMWSPMRLFMCGDTVVTNTPMFIHQSTQIIQIHVSNLMLRYVCYREIRWDDYVLHYILGPVLSVGGPVVFPPSILCAFNAISRQ
jgi:hypothetical protein